MNFEQILNSAPQFIKTMFLELSQLRERPDYHPEENAAAHIKIVTDRCCMATNNVNLIMAGFFHDIMKAKCAKINPKTGWPTSPGHDTAAERLIRINIRVQQMIESYGASVETVAWLVGQHMRIKQIDKMRPFKQKELRSHPWFNLLQALNCADDMLITDAEALKKMQSYLNKTEEQCNYDIDSISKNQC